MRSYGWQPVSWNRHSDNKYHFKMTKTRTVTFLMMIISVCALVLSMTDAHPLTNDNLNSNSTDSTPHTRNDSRLVITHIVKTIEFQVGIIDDDQTNKSGDNSTEEATEQYIETDIKLLNVNLLRELLDKATESDTSSTTAAPQETSSRQETTGN